MTLLTKNTLLMIFNREPLRGLFCVCIPIPPVAAYGVNWGLLAESPTGFFGGIPIPPVAAYGVNWGLLAVLP